MEHDSMLALKVIFPASLTGIMPGDVLSAKCRLRYLINRSVIIDWKCKERDSFPLSVSLNKMIHTLTQLLWASLAATIKSRSTKSQPWETIFRRSQKSHLTLWGISLSYIFMPHGFETSGGLTLISIYSPLHFNLYEMSSSTS